MLISPNAQLSSDFSLLVVSVLFVVTLFAAVWISFLKWRLKWRMAAQRIWIDRSTAIAAERSRVLEIVSSNHRVDDLLSEICASVIRLLPGAECTYTLRPENEITGTGCEDPDSGKVILFEIALRNDAERLAGKIVASSSGQIQAEDREAVRVMVAELASLSMRHSQLYRGLVHHSTHDPLTELPNRRLYESRLAEALKWAEQRGNRLAVIYIDVNRFKYVNDKFGHKIGDLYLQQISARLKHQLRSIDLLARVGGDEFIVIAPFPETADRAHAVISRLKGCFNEPFLLDGKVITGSASFGYARYPQDGTTADELTRVADHAMYVCKHDAHIAQEARGVSLVTPDELGLALINGDFRLAYQPQFSASGELRGLEVLLRLEHPTLGFIPPGAFIAVAERHSVIVDIGAWALRVALQDATRWNLASGPLVTLGVNVSTRQLQEPEYAASVLRCLEEHDFPADRLEIELIERSLMLTEEEPVLQQLEQLRRAGVRISLDDFGTEQSCLGLLHKLPIDTIKIDHGFIRAMDDEPKVLPIIQAIVYMARSLGKRVIAEGIEHIGPVPALLNMGSMDFQGYLLSRPLPAAEVDELIAGWRSGIVMPDAFQGQLRFAGTELIVDEPQVLPSPFKAYDSSAQRFPM
ncbi:MAG TPA: bifunctional diguanylate cyclase/phosphodiesterase [Acidobacteriaceae bacterium]|nr:bifunctional diguanylate cyclase/phosphodiesterase [Acidobacteriaceae bacterium]